MPTDHPAGQDGISRPRVIVSVTATADGRVTLSRMERLLDDGPNLRWKATWPPDVSDLLARRAAAIEQRHHPAVVLEGSGTFVADDAGSLSLPDTSVPADVLRADFLPYRSPRWFAIGGLGTPSIMDGPPLGTGSLPEQLRAIDVQVGSHGTIWAHYEVVAR